MNLIKFPSIEQFRNIVANVNREHNFVGLDAAGEAIYDLSKPKPTLTFKGTVKLHGTNFGVSYSAADGIWAQSRENIITPERDNAGSALFVKANSDVFMKLFKQIEEKLNINGWHNIITIYGEWVGKGIQKGVAISGIDKSMFIFAVKITPLDEAKSPAYWVDSSYLRDPEHRIYNIEDYETFSIDIDFNNPQAVQNKIIEMTLKVEDECPVGKAFGISDIGEGIVFSHLFPDGKLISFKSKGEKHSKSSKVKTLKPVDDEKLNKVINVTNEVCISWRLNQALTTACNLLNGGTIDRKYLGDYIRLVIADIIKEDSDILADNGLSVKEISGKVSEVARQYFFAKQNEEVGLNA